MLSLLYIKRDADVNTMGDCVFRWGMRPGGDNRQMSIPPRCDTHVPVLIAVHATAERHFWIPWIFAEVDFQRLGQLTLSRTETQTQQDSSESPIRILMRFGMTQQDSSESPIRILMRFAMMQADCSFVETRPNSKRAFHQSTVGQCVVIQFGRCHSIRFAPFPSLGTSHKKSSASHHIIPMRLSLVGWLLWHLSFTKKAESDRHDCPGCLVFEKESEQQESLSQKERKITAYIHWQLVVNPMFR